jgi:hypothetical protein
MKTYKTGNNFIYVLKVPLALDTFPRSTFRLTALRGHLTSRISAKIRKVQAKIHYLNPFSRRTHLLENFRAGILYRNG